MKIKVKIKSKKDIKYYSPDTQWTSFNAQVQDILEDDGYKIIVKGMEIKVAGVVTFAPQSKGIYIIMGEYVKDEKWGWQFKINGAYEDVEINTIDEKKQFLSQILTERQVNSLFDTFEDPFVPIKKEDVKELTKAKFIGELTATRIIEKFKATIDLAPAYTFFCPLGVGTSLINKLCETYKGAENAIKKFKKNPYILADDIKGIGFLRADTIALKYKIDLTSPYRIRSGIKYLLKNEAETVGSTWLSQDDFASKIKELLKIDLSDIEKIVKDLYVEGELYVDKDRIALQYYYDLEKRIAKKILALQNYKVDNYDLKELDKKIKAAEEEQGFEFTDEQLNAIKSILNNNVSLVTGLAGTGKTTIMKGVYYVLPKSTLISQCAFSGQASKRIGEATGYPSSTIHRLLKYQGKKFYYNIDRQLITDIVVIDEISMVGIELFWSLIQAIPLGTKLIMLGDNGQLPPIGIGNLLNDLLNCNKINDVKLTKIHRQAEKSAIITKSRDIRDKKFLLSNNFEGEKQYGELFDLNLYANPEKDGLFDRVLSIFMREYERNKDLQKIQIIVAQNQKVELARDKINNAIQQMINPKRGTADKEIKIRYSQTLRVGDKVINRENHYDVETPEGEQTSIYNGSIGIVKVIANNYIVVDFYNEGEVIINYEYYGSLELAYAITCHSSQGSQFDTVIVAFDNSSYILLSNEWLYTAITRAKNMCYVIVQTNAFNMAVLHHRIIDRNTFLLEMLEGENNEKNE